MVWSQLTVDEWRSCVVTVHMVWSQFTVDEWRSCVDGVVTVHSG